jgi:GGDEF domain-containing protein
LVGDRLREIFEQSTLTIASKELKFTVSIGGAVSNADDTSNKIQFRAAKNMFSVKKYGGNGVLIES